MAQVRVDVAKPPPRHGPVKRTLHWADRAMLGAVMGVAAFVLERLVVRGTKKANAASAANAGTGDDAVS